MSGALNPPPSVLMSPAQASQLLDEIVYDRVRELIDVCCLLDFEQELSRALADCGVARTEVPTVSAHMIARAFTRIGERHVKLATEPCLGFTNGHPKAGSPGD